MRKPQRVSFGVDVGGTYAKIGALSAAGRTLLETKIPTLPQAGPRHFVRRLSGLVNSWLAQNNARLSSLGLAVAGDVDSGRGVLRFSPNLQVWNGFNFRAALRRALGVRSAVENDANAAVWGAHVLELKSRPKNVLGVTLGTGVGGGLILDGRLYRGSTGTSGEIGHIIVEPDGRKCNCGVRGCLEAYAGGAALVRRARELFAQNPRAGKILARLHPGLKGLEPRHLSLAARKGDALSRAVLREAGERLGQALVSLVLVLNVDVILILGGVSGAGRWLLGPADSAMRRHPCRMPFRRARLRLADNPHSGWIGAALLGARG